MNRNHNRNYIVIVYDKKNKDKVRDCKFCKDIIDCEHYLHEQYEKYKYKDFDVFKNIGLIEDDDLIQLVKQCIKRLKGD